MNDCKEVYLSCEDKAEVVQFVKYKWDDGDVFYELNVLDSYCREGTEGLFKRVKRAWRAFWAKPVYYTGIFVEDEEKVKKFLKDALSTIEEQD